MTDQSATPDELGELEDRREALRHLTWLLQHPRIHAVERAGAPALYGRRIHTYYGSLHGLRELGPKDPMVMRGTVVLVDIALDQWKAAIDQMCGEVNSWEGVPPSDWLEEECPGIPGLPYPLLDELIQTRITGPDTYRLDDRLSGMMQQLAVVDHQIWWGRLRRRIAKRAGCWRERDRRKDNTVYALLCAHFGLNPELA